MEQDEEIADEERLRVSDVLDAELLAERQQTRSDLTAAQRAAEDRTWTFGHVIVDEAQELSAMTWRVLMRRCPSRSMTLVGDIAQTGALGGAASWHEVLSPYVGGRWRLAELTVNYRTPAEIMGVAAELLSTMDVELAPPASVRTSGHEPWTKQVPQAELASAVPELVDAELARVDGTLAVLVPPRHLEQVGTGVTERVPDAVVGAQPEGVESRVVVLTVQQSKGLEFDSVLLVDPDSVLAESARGTSDLYVGLTRATQRLGVVHTGELPGVLSGAGNL